MKTTPFWIKTLTWQVPDSNGGAGADTPDATPADPPSTDATPEDPPSGPDLSFVPDTYRGDDGALDMEKFGQDYQEMLADQARRAEQQGLVPEAYEWAAPEDLEMPEGIEIDLDLENEAFQPILQDMGSLLKSMSAPQDAANKIVGMLMKYEAAHATMARDALKAETDKLGANDAARKARIDTMDRALAARLPADGARRFTELAQQLLATRHLTKPIRSENI